MAEKGTRVIVGCKSRWNSALFRKASITEKYVRRLWLFPQTQTLLKALPPIWDVQFILLTAYPNTPSATLISSPPSTKTPPCSQVLYGPPLCTGQSSKSCPRRPSTYGQYATGISAVSFRDGRSPTRRLSQALPHTSLDTRGNSGIDTFPHECSPHLKKPPPFFHMSSTHPY